MRPVRQSPFRCLMCVSAFALYAALSTTLFISQAAAQTPGVLSSDSALQGLQSSYLNEPIQHFYSAEAAEAPAIASEDLELANLAMGNNRRIYRQMDQIRATVAQDQALAIFLNDPKIGPQLRQTLHQAVLYTCLPRRGVTGFNDYYVGNGAPAIPPRNPAKQGRRALRGKAAGDTAATAPAGAQEANGAASAPRQSGFLGDLQKTGAQAGNGNNGAAGSPLLQRIGVARQAMMSDFSILVGLTPNGKQAMLYVLGSLPQNPNAATPINFTIEGRQYDESVAEIGGNSSQSMVLIDKQALPPASDQARYFCYVYSLSTPASETQADLLISYWPDPSVAVTHGVALLHSDRSASGNDPMAPWITIPMTRVQRYNPRMDLRYTVLSEAQPGDPLRNLYRDKMIKNIGARRVKQKKNPNL